MRILSEQSTGKLRIAAKDIEEMDDSEFMDYIIELRGNRGKTVKKATARDGSATSKSKAPKSKPHTSSTGVAGDDFNF